MLHQIKRIIYILIILAIYNTSATAQCYNGDVEANNFTGWTGWTDGNVSQDGVLSWPKMKPGIINGRHTIMNIGNDPLLLANSVTLPMVAEGNHSIRLGDPLGNSSSEIIAYTFTVTNANFSFKYAMVMAHPDQGHQAKGRPYFSYMIARGPAALNIKTLLGIIQYRIFRSDPNDPFYNTVYTQNYPIVYKNWQTECVDLSAYIGQQVTIYFTTTDCHLGGHFSYAYIDGLCKTNNPVPDFTYPSYICQGDGLWVDGSLSQNATDYYWHLEPLSSNNINNVINTFPPRAAFFYNSPPGYIGNLLKQGNMWLFAYPKGYYKLTLGVKNCNSNWVTKSVVIEIRVPQLSVNEYVYRCCGDPLPTLVATVEDVPGAAIGAFNWFDAEGTLLGVGTTEGEVIGATFTITNTFVVPSENTGKYRVVYTDENGCWNEKWVYVINKPDFSGSFSTSFCYGNCSSNPDRITVNPSFINPLCGSPLTFETLLLLQQTGATNLTYLWNTGETTQTIYAQPGMNNYTVTISNGCFSHTYSIDISTFHHLTGPIEESYTYDPGKLYIPKKMYPKGSQNNPGGPIPVTPFTISEWGLPAGAKPAYNASDFDFKIYNRWGQNLHHLHGPVPCEGLFNGELTWDGKYQKGRKKGDYVDMGTYYYQLKIKNCNTDWQLFKGDFTVIY